MLRVGLTGNIGSGKSTVARVWESLGARVIDADRIARDLLEPDSPVLQEVIDAFGGDLLDGKGELDRRKLAGRVFGDPEAVNSLNEIVHPPVIRKIREMMDEDPRNDTIFVIEAALIIESGGSGDYNVIVMVDCGLESRVDRVVESRGMTRDEVLRIEGSQMNAAAKRSRADIVIENDGDLEFLRRESRRVFRELMRMEKERRNR